jgi:hypothetical protein
MDTMTEGDLNYPLMCPTKCGYNFCMTCVEHLVESSQHDYQEASDGNRHVKVKLQCPQCRGSLIHTIRDTLLMRKAVVASNYTDVPDSELNATQLRIKHDFSQNYAKEVEHAQARLRKFQRDNNHGIIRESIHLTGSNEEQNTFKDSTLFGGMDYAMSEAEQSYVTQLMISGDTDQLAQAAQILHGTMELSMYGTTPSMKSSAPSFNGNRQAEIRKLALAESFRKRYPLPARMPKYVILKVFDTKKNTLTFTNDEWDGSIADAFTRVRAPAKKNLAVDRILSLADGEFCAGPKARVKIRSIKGEAGRLGLQKGDVVTHVNGEPWEGTAEALSELITGMYEVNQAQTFTVVVNAEPATAEVLKLRGLACQLLAVEDDV